MLPKRDNCRKVFVSKGYLPQMYKWSPGCTTYTPNAANKIKSGNINPTFCNATAGSQGQDWITTYVYNIVIVDNKQQHSAYVACDYVQ